MKERVWINCVAHEIVFQPVHADTALPSRSDGAVFVFLVS